MDEHDFTPEQSEFLREFADHYRYGRHFMCSFAHFVAWLGGAVSLVAGLAFLYWHNH